MNRNFVFFCLVSCILSLVSLSGCVFPHRGADVTVNKTGPGYEETYHEQRDDFGRPKIRHEVHVGGGHGAYGGPYGGYYGGAIPPGALDYPEAEYWEYDCYETASGQQICPERDSVMPYVAEGDEFQPGMTPNARRDAQIRDLQRSRDASDRQHMNQIRLERRREFCRKNPSRCQ
ncbi:MAG: hypothetical protein ACOYUZ_04375 [Patescibacteria group bacterium]